MNVIELFSGIGAQAKALERRNIEHNILATCDWDINAIIAYDLIHNGPQTNNIYGTFTLEQLNERLFDLNISNNGKVAMSNRAKKNLPRVVKEKLLYAIDRTNNLVDVTTVNGGRLPQNIDLLTYSFPCQDLSLAGSWHNNEGGINRNSGNRSSLLWEVERILVQRNIENMIMPRFLLMENVSAIESTRHITNFNEWQRNLEMLGYSNKVYRLDARNFGVPQMRNRTYMLSVYIQDLEQDVLENILHLLENMTNERLSEVYARDRFYVRDVLKLDYTNNQYLEEAELSNPNVTPSRIDIYNENLHIDLDTLSIPTVTTKQDRHPNSGVLEYISRRENKMNFRYLTPRECFLFMGFNEIDYQILIDNDFMTRRNRHFFTRDKLNKMAGNSICVNVLESIFEFISDLQNVINE